MHFMRDDYAVKLAETIEAVIGQYPESSVVITDANGTPPKQLADMENLVVQGVDAIIVIPIDEKAILPAIKKANDKNIPVVAITCARVWGRIGTRPHKRESGRRVFRTRR